MGLPYVTLSITASELSGMGGMGGWESLDKLDWVACLLGSVLFGRFHFETSLTRLSRAIAFGARISLLSIPGPSR